MIRLVQDMRVFVVDCECKCGTTATVNAYSPLMACGELEREGWQFPVVDDRLRTFCPECSAEVLA